MKASVILYSWSQEPRALAALKNECMAAYRLQVYSLFKREVTKSTVMHTDLLPLTIQDL